MSVHHSTTPNIPWYRIYTEAVNHAWFTLVILRHTELITAAAQDARAVVEAERQRDVLCFEQVHLDDDDDDDSSMGSNGLDAYHGSSSWPIVLPLGQSSSTIHYHPSLLILLHNSILSVNLRRSSATLHPPQLSQPPRSANLLLGRPTFSSAGQPSCTLVLLRHGLWGC